MNRTILSVEDDENDSLFLKLALEDAGLAENLRTVSNGSEAMDYLNCRGKFRNRNEYPLPYLVLLDLNLPYITGIEILQWMRQQEKFSSTIVIPLSSSCLPEDISQAKALGANDYLIKPATLEGWRRTALKLRDRWFLHKEMVRARPGALPVRSGLQIGL